MPELTETRLNRVYPAERWGNTLVVIPKGDAAGFSVTSVNTEMAVITTLFDRAELKHLVIDLSSGNYFGSVVLGALVQLGTAVRNRGGRIAMAGASTDMQDILRLMKLDQMWELYADRQAALRAIADIPVGERLWARRKFFVGGLIAAGVVAAIIWMPRPVPGHSQYAQMQELWREVESKRLTGTSEEWARLKQRCEKLLQPIVKELESSSKQRGLRGAELDLLLIARDHWLQSMDRTGPPHSTEMARHYAIFHFRCAEALLNNRPRPAATFMAPAGDSTTPEPTPTSEAATPTPAEN